MASVSGSEGEAAVQHVQEVLRRFRTRMGHLASCRQAKPDMVAYKELREELTPKSAHGHIPGVKPGDEFNGRGELAILGLHKQILRGIDVEASEPKGAFAIVMSGGYVDDEDEGNVFYYTGEGGQPGNNARQQVRNQEWTKGNLALKHNQETETPVRVFRAKKDEASGQRRYVYEGLYYVRSAERVPSKDGPLVCRFRMEGVPGQSVTSTKVDFNIFKSGSKLCGRMRLADARKRSRVQETLAQARARVDRAAMLASIRRRPHLVCEDVANGQELVPIPVFNDVNDEKLPPGLEYFADYDHSAIERDAVVQARLREAEELTAAWRADAGTCGLKLNRHMVALDAELRDRARKARAEAGLPVPAGDGHGGGGNPNGEMYTDDGRLTFTDPMGIHECDVSRCRSQRCATNTVVTAGPSLPLEVFMTANKGWGVRCAAPIAVGSFVCAYVGTLLTDVAANKLKAQDLYLYDLNHFYLIKQELDAGAPDGLPDEDLAVHRMPPLPPDVPWTTAAAAGPLSPPLQATTAAAAAAEGAAPAPAGATAAGPPSAPSDGAATATAASVASPISTPVKAKPGRGAVHASSAAAAEAPSTSAAAGGAAAAAAAPSAAMEVGPASTTAAAAAAVAPRSPAPVSPLKTASGAAAGPSSVPASPQSPTSPGGGSGGSGTFQSLVVDARTRGNVARFINHSCCGNCLIQTVFAKKATTGLLYYTGIFAARDIPAGEELAYDYGYHKSKGLPGAAGGRQMHCHCGAPECKGLLLGF